ncbi:MAG: imidazolonepropionase [Candidatus Solibacter sp.]|nr:imidazolonepropionase [Candidatus Solibacter sp.]
MLVRDGVLVEVGPSRRVENLAEARTAVEINAAGRVVMPGLVDSHTHLAFPPAGVNEQDEQALVRALRAATGQRLELRCRAFLDAMARHGTTTVEMKTGCGFDESGEAKLMRIVAALRNDPVNVIPSYLFRLSRTADAAALHQATEWTVSAMLPKIRRRLGTAFADLVWNSNPDHLPFFERYLGAARDLGYASRIHAEGPDPAAAIALAIRQRAAGIDHLEHATEFHARQVADAGILVTLLPGVSFHNDRQSPPARTLIDSGAAIALGTNFNPHHTPMLSMQTIIALACWRLRMTLEEAISASTINGAHALGCADRTGSLELGKSADLLILNTSDYRDLSNSIGTNVVHVTMKGGRFIYKEGDVSPRPPQIVTPNS